MSTQLKPFVRGLAHWWWLVMLSLLVGVVLGKALAAAFRPTYQATALVQLTADVRSTQVLQPVAAYIATARSDTVLDPVLRKYPSIDRQTFVTKQLAVTGDGPSQTISIQVTLPGARMAANIANTVASLLVTQQNALIHARYSKQAQMLGGQITDEQHRIDALNQKIIQTPTSDTAAIQQLGSEETQLQQLQRQDIANLQSLTAEQGLYSSPLSIVQLAAPPTSPSSITQFVPLFPVVLIFTVLLSLVASTWLERAIGPISGTAALQEKASLPILGSLRWTRSCPSETPLQVLSDARSSFAEDCRMMMADVLFHAEESRSRVLAITGLHGGAGSSTAAAHLAALLAQTGRRVILVDANLHAPVQHTLLGVSDDSGLADLLGEARALNARASSTKAKQSIQLAVSERQSERAHAAVDPPEWAASEETTESNRIMPAADGRENDVTVTAKVNGRVKSDRIERTALIGWTPDSRDGHIGTTTVDNLHVLPAGKASVGPIALLCMPEMKGLLEWAAQRSDFVVVDCPALTHAEAHVLGALSDETLLVVDATRDTVQQVLNAKEGLTNTAVKVSGLVVNKLGRWV